MMSVASAFLFVGLAFEIYCFISLRKERNKKYILLLAALTFIYIALYSVFSYDVIARVIVTSVFHPILFGILFVELAIKKGSSKLQKLIGWVALLFIIINVVRGLISALLKFEFHVYADSWVQYIMGIMWLFVAYTFPLIYLFILKEKDATSLQELNSTKDKFFRIIGHDLRGPMGHMIQFSELIRDNYEDLNKEIILKLAKMVNESSLRNLKLLENLLEWARSQTGSISFVPEQFSISELVRDNIELVREEADRKGIEIPTPVLYEGSVFADRNMINTVIRNLLSNAVKFTRTSGKIEIINQLVKGKLIVSVKDSGVGISNEDIRKLFRIDVEHSTVGTDNEKGTGIGLILCKEFIDRHNGSMWVDSKLGEGTTFSFSLQLKG
jgi:signal transduction histidine kinase